ncbi:MAG TPA: hypothetical protein H9662_10235 [Firmicutes bacterium]|mgnify:FL=1|nr:hypothetical protein [Bacillota bacterium]
MEERKFANQLQQVCQDRGYEQGISLLKEHKVPYAACTVTVQFEDVLNGLWQTQVLKKRVLRIAETVILAILAGMYLISFVRNFSYVMGLVLGIICLLILAALWIVPHMEARSTASAYAANTKRFSICISKEGIFADNEGLCTFFPMDGNMLVYETKKYFNLLIENRRLYVIPKTCLSDEDIRYLTGLFKEKVEGFKKM